MLSLQFITGYTLPSNRLVCLEEDSFSLRRTNADMAAMVEMRRTELETAKTQLLSEQSNNSKLRITLQSIEHTVAALSLKHGEETAFLEGEVARVSEVLTAKVDTFREWLNSKRKASNSILWTGCCNPTHMPTEHLGILNSFYSHPIPGEDKAVTGSSVLSSQEGLASAVSEGENQPHPSMLYDTPDAQRIG